MARPRCQRGNTLLLMPAAVLVLFVLAAVAVDAAVLFLGQRRVADLAASVAQDAVAAIDRGSFYEDDLHVDEADARTREAALRDELPTDDGFDDPRCELTAVGVRVEVTCTATVRLIFAPAIPGSRHSRTVEATETAEGRHE